MSAVWDVVSVNVVSNYPAMNVCGGYSGIALHRSTICVIIGVLVIYDNARPEIS